MKVEYLFSNNKKAGSRLISWAAKYEKLDLENYPSHVAVLLNENLVIESTFSTGVRIIPYKKWIMKNHEVARIPCNNLYQPSMDVFEKLTDLWGKKYDWKGIGYFAIKYLGLILFNKPMPHTNKWQRSSHYFCTEFAEVLSGHSCSMNSPAKLLKEWTNGVTNG